MNKKMNRRGIAPLFIILWVILALVIIYLILFIPIPAFTSLRTQINYFLILIFWVVLQVGIIIGYYKVGTYALKGISAVRFKVVNWSLNIRDYIITHS
jgi:hypothetical protein